MISRSVSTVARILTRKKQQVAVAVRRQERRAAEHMVVSFLLVSCSLALLSGEGRSLLLGEHEEEGKY